MSTAIDGAAPAAQASVTPQASVTTPSVSPNGHQAAAAVSPGASDPATWKAAMNEDLRGYIDGKGFKGPEILAEAYRNFEKLQGVPQDKIIKLANEIYDKDGKLTPDGRGVWERLGTPKEAKDYKLEVPPGGDAKVSEHFANVFHEAGVPKAMAEQVVKSFNAFSAQQEAAHKQQLAAKYTQEKAALEQEWGMAFEQNTNIAKSAVGALGISAQQIDAIQSALGLTETMKMFNKLGKSVGESPFITGRPAGGAMEPGAAREQIRTLMQDSGFRAKVIAGDTEAKSKWDSLHKYAYGS